MIYVCLSRFPGLLRGRELQRHLPAGARPRNLHPQPHRGKPQSGSATEPTAEPQMDPAVPRHTGLRSDQPVPLRLGRADPHTCQRRPGLPEVLVPDTQGTRFRAVQGDVQNRNALLSAERAVRRAGAVRPAQWVWGRVGPRCQDDPLLIPGSFGLRNSNMTKYEIEPINVLFFSSEDCCFCLIT